ncbi:hypothetical protein [Pseudomonas sp.]|uniref:hypothetical protein n=1 Tax=Pseudomonas sp. TaxID=306 RepID=UPI002ED7B3FF
MSPMQDLPFRAGPTALNDLEIPGRIGPLPEPPAQPGETLWGINHGAALDNFPHNGLQLYIPPWSAMGQGDSVSVLLNGTVVTTEFIDAAEVSLRVTAFVDAVRLTPGDHVLQYRVTRLNQTPETSAETHILVKLDRPGGQDQDGDTPGHSAFKFTLPQAVINEGVDGEAAKAGVPVSIEPYPQMAEGDDIRFSWGGEFIHHKVTAAEVGHAIEITVDEAVILAGGDSGDNGLAVTYEVYDIVENRSEDWAAEIRIVVDTGNSRLDAPFVKEAFNNMLDLDTLSGGPVTVQIVAATTREMLEQLTASLTGKETPTTVEPFNADFVVGDKIVVTLMGTTSEGEPIVHEAPVLTIENLPHIFEIGIPNAVVRQLAQTQAVFTYRLIHLDGTTSKSRGAYINVIGEAVRMAAPVALDAMQGALDPELATTIVQVPWDDSMEAGDQITPKWIGTRPDFTVYDPQLSPHNITNREATSKAPINFTVAGTHLKAIEGGTLGLYFILAKDVNGTIVERESARATTLNVGEPRAELPAPTVAGVVDGVVDPLVGATTLTVSVYPAMEVGDEIHYLWRGSEGGDVTDWINITSFTRNKPVVFDVYAEDITANDGGTVETWYWVIHAGSGHRSDSDVLAFSVGAGQLPLLSAPLVAGSEDGVLGLEEIPDGAKVVVSPWAGMAPGDLVEMLWQDDKGTPPYTASKNITGNAVGKDVLFEVALAEVRNNVGANVTVTYIVTPLQGKDRPSLPLTFAVQEQPAVQLPAPSIVEAIGSTLDPAAVLNGAHVTIRAGAQLKPGDEVTLSWLGQAGAGSVSPVKTATAAGEMVFDIGYATVAANDGHSVTLSYTVKRSGGAAEGPSPVAIYDIKTSIGAGKLKVMGARSNPGVSPAPSAPRHISVFEATTGAALSAQWQYEGDGDNWIQGTTFRDTHPELVLRVRTSNDVVALNPVNIIGSGYQGGTGSGAMVARRDTGDVVCWGNAAHGGQIPSSIIYLDDIVEVSCTRSAYAARRQNGEVVVWGNEADGGRLGLSEPGVSAVNFVRVFGSCSAFGGITTAGNVLAWGNATNGGTVPASIATLTDISHLEGNVKAFAAIRRNGMVVAWGDPDWGGSVPPAIAALNDITSLIGSKFAFAALRSTGSVVAWGYSYDGGEVPQQIAALNDIVELGGSTDGAFSLIRTNGQVMAWGNSEYGSTVPNRVASLRDIVEVSGTFRAFAARRSSGHVVVWGDGSYGGSIHKDIAVLDDIVQVIGNFGAFAALRRNGEVVAWGPTASGGDVSTVLAQLHHVQAIYANWRSFVALTSDGRVVTWGEPESGGDSSAVQHLLCGKVSYLASPASRGRTLADRQSLEKKAAESDNS